MLLSLLCLACGGTRFAQEPYSVERSAPWSLDALPEGRTVLSQSDSLVVRYADSEPVAQSERWGAALTGAGFELSDDHSRAASIVRTYVRGETRWGLSITAQRGETTVRLADLGAR